jgi:ribosomal protein L31E
MPTVTQRDTERAEAIVKHVYHFLDGLAEQEVSRLFALALAEERERTWKRALEAVPKKIRQRLFDKEYQREHDIEISWCNDCHNKIKRAALADGVTII